MSALHDSRSLELSNADRDGFDLSTLELRHVPIVRELSYLSSPPRVLSSFHLIALCVDPDIVAGVCGLYPPEDTALVILVFLLFCTFLFLSLPF
jgi:hypothetical protein